MKRLILFELIVLFLATTFESDSPPGWFQQVLPRTDFFVNDIFFLDSSNGWVVTRNATNDTAFVLKTTNGGTNWVTTWQQKAYYFEIQFINNITGYIAGSSGSGTGKFYKTIDGGINWNLMLSAGNEFVNLFFVNKDTGWICDDDGTFGAGLLKTTNGGSSWTQQLPNTSQPSQLFFINSDTGWTICQQTKILKTTDGGANWNQISTFPQSLADIFFTGRDTGYVSGGGGSTSVKITTDGGFTWISSSGSLGGREIFFINKKIGFGADVFSTIEKTTDGGLNWFTQSVPSGNYYAIQFTDTNNGWAGGSKLIHTTEGGGPPVGILYAGTEASNYKLDQNFPNPFNPTTIIFFKLQEKSTVELLVYNILGEEVAEMVDDNHFTAGVYQFGFDASKYDLPSGVYFYRLTAKSEVSDNVFIDTKKMILIK